MTFPRFAISAAVALSLFVATRAAAQTPTNTTTVTSSANWSAYTWTGGTPPTGGLATTVLRFNMSGSTSYTATNNLGALAGTADRTAGEFQLNGLLLNNTSTTNGLTLAATGGSFLNFVANGGVNPVLNQNAAGAVTISSPVTITDSLTLGGTGTGTMTISGVIDGAGSLAFSGANTTVLSGANTAFTGNVTLNSGTLDLRNAGALGTTARTFTINGGTLNNGSGGSITLSANNAITLGGNFTFTGTQSLNLGTGAVTLTGNRVVTANASTLTFGGAVGESGGSFGLTKAGNGTLVLGSGNTYTGATAVNAGTLQFNSSAAAINGSTARDISTSGLGTLVFNAASVGDLATLVATRITAGSTGGLGLTSAQAGFNFDPAALGVPGLFLGATGNVTYAGTYTPAADQVYRLGAGSGTLVYNASLTDNGSTAGSLFTKGSLTLGSASNTYTGSTTIGAGTLTAATIADVGQASTLGAPTTAALGVIRFGTGNVGGGLTITGAGGTTNRGIDLAGTTGGATLNFSGTGTQTFAGPLTASVAGAKTLTLSGTGNAALTSPVADGSGSVISLTKAGTGAWTLFSPLSTFTGQTSVTAGTLRLGADNALAPLSTVAITSGATLDLNGFAATVGQLNGSGAGSGGTLNLGSGGALTFGANNTASVNTSAVVITGTGSILRIGSGQYVPGAVSTFSGTATFEGGGETALAGGGSAARFTGLTTLTVRGGGLFRYTSTAGNNTAARIGGAVITGTTTGTNPNVALGDALVPGGTYNPGSPSSGSYTEALGTLIVAPGANSIGSAVGGGTVVLSFGTNNVPGLTRSAGGTINIAAANTVTAVQFTGTGAPTLTNNILGGYFTFGGVDWATLTGPNNLVAALPVGSYQTANTPSTWLATDNVSLNATATPALAGDLAIYSLRLNVASAALDLGGNTLTIGSGGILNNDRTSTISNGSITSGNGQDLIVTGPNPTSGANTLTISARITGNVGLTKSGNNGLTLGGGTADTTPNDYAGPTYINGGTVTLNKATDTAAVSNVVVVSGTNYSGTSIPGTLAFNQAGQLRTDTQLTVSYGGAVNFANNASPTIQSLTFINGSISGLTALTLNGTGTNVLTIGGNGLTDLTSVTLTGTSGGGVRFDSTRATGGTATTIAALNLGGVSRTFTIDNGPAADDLIVTTLNTGSAAITVTKNGAGTLNVGTAGNFQAGSTLLINAGTFRIGTSNTFSSTGGNAGPTIALGGGTFAAQNLSGMGTNQGNLNQLSLVGGNSTLALGAGDHTLLFTTPSYTGGTLLITGSLADGSGAVPTLSGHIRFSGYGSDAAAANAANQNFLANVQFSGFSPGQATFVTVGSFVELVPMTVVVPEPATAGLIAFAGLALGALARRRNRRA